MTKEKQWLGIVLLLAGVILALAGMVWFHSSGDLLRRLAAGERPAGARARLAELAVNNPNDLTVQAWLLRLETEAGDLDAAERRLAMLTIKAPDQYATALGGCLLAIQKEEWQKAASACEKAAQLSGNEEDRNRLGLAYLKAGKVNQALPILQEFLRRHPHDPKAANNLGYAYLSKKDYPEAERLFRAALQLDPKFISAHRNLARLRFETGKYPGAVQQLQALLELDPNDAEALYNLAIIYAVKLHDPAAAKKYAQKALSRGLSRERAQALAPILFDDQKKPAPGNPPSP